MFRYLLFPIAAAAIALAQSPPNFSGAWTQDPSMPAPGPGDRRYANRIEHHGRSLHFTTIITRGGRLLYSFDREYTIGGKPLTSIEADGRQVTWSAAWEGRTLVIQSEEKSNHPGFRGFAVSVARWLGQPAGILTTRETWSLSEDGKRLTKRLQTTYKGNESGQTTMTFIRDEAPAPGSPPSARTR